jgi:hypothetical protein
MKLTLLIALCSFQSQLFSYIINQSGRVCLEGNVVESGDVVIINASNVYLDLNGHSVSGGTKGIVVNSGLSNITIVNGRISDCSRGISINDNCSFIALQDLEIERCANRAIEVLGTVGNVVINLTIDAVSIENCCTSLVADYVISLTFVQDTSIHDTRILKNGSGLSAALCMLLCEQSSKSSLDGLNISCNTGALFEGIRVSDSVGIVISGCFIQSNTASASFAGIRFSGGATNSGHLCKACVVANNSSVSGPLAGYELLALATRITCSNCIAFNNGTSGAIATASCYGFNVDQPTFVQLSECYALFNRATGASTNICAGFNIGTSDVGTTGTKNSYFFSNQAVRNNASSDALSFGFRVVSAVNGNTGNVFSGNYGVKNGPTTPTVGNQITSTSNPGSSPGGVPPGSLLDRNDANLNRTYDYTNVRII